MNMNTVPKITQSHVDKACDELRRARVNDYLQMKNVDICNKAIEIALAEQSAQQETYITADEARKLGAGNAEWYDYLNGWWVMCDGSCKYREQAKYRAIKQAQPEPTTVQQTPTEAQPWLYWGGGECPVPDGCTFEATCRSGTVRGQKEVSDWTHTGHSGDIIAYRITGLAEGYKMQGVV